MPLLLSFHRFFVFHPRTYTDYAASLIRRLHTLCKSERVMIQYHAASLKTAVRARSDTSSVCRIRLAVGGATADVGYVDVGPLDGPLVLLIHGAPGGLDDFTELCDLLSKAGIRLLIPEFPGFGNTTLSSGAQYDESTTARAELVLNFLKALRVTRAAAVLGHSMGAAAACHLSATTNIFQSSIFLNPITLTPHAAVRPFWFSCMLAWLLDNRLTKGIFSSFLHFAYTRRGFKLERDTQGLEGSLIAVTRIGFEQFKMNAIHLKEKRVPLFFAFTQNDKLVDWQLQLVLTKECGLSDAEITWLDAKNNVVAGPNLKNITFPRALIFERGGHIVHISQLEIISESIIALVRLVHDLPDRIKSL